MQKAANFIRKETAKIMGGLDSALLMVLLYPGFPHVSSENCARTPILNIN